MEKWISIERESFRNIDTSKVEVLFDTEETCMFEDDWPIAFATHYRVL